MKTFDSLTEAELTELSQDDIRRYVDYACADNGVALLPTLPPEPKPVTFTPDAKVYTVGHSLNFATLEEATRVMEAINANNPIDTEYLSTPSTVTRIGLSNRRATGITVASQDAFSLGRATELKLELSGAKIAEDIYAKAKKDYDGAVKERQAYADEIAEKVEDAWDVRRRRESRQRDWNRYLDLADGNKEIALRFLTRAHSDTQQLLPELFSTEEMQVAL